MQAKTLHIECSTPEETALLGRALGNLLFPGSIVALIGPLGAGKTWFVRSIAEGLDIPMPSQVTSPTFVLIQEYEARIPIYHFDAYRLQRVSEFEDLGALEYFSGQGVCLVEWADRIESLLPEEHLRVELLVKGKQSREVILSAKGERYESIISFLAQAKVKIKQNQQQP